MASVRQLFSFNSWHVSLHNLQTSGGFLFVRFLLSHLPVLFFSLFESSIFFSSGWFLIFFFFLVFNSFTIIYLGPFYLYLFCLKFIAESVAYYFLSISEVSVMVSFNIAFFPFSVFLLFGILVTFMLGFHTMSI